ncbi:TonB-dependent receptor [Bordetella genomosp. 12]|uniref:TonB-dependent siderophore receptor n=1 Tax=Bordetella genomosp. 12 TaxID=463035 RepID=A0A261V996_9BORD|nr:TonB-dependent receptor [Bordetella genomosp. 12]OZI70679.1 TonB-dependent siderophore receptor [Bordetella genomosp. 12]
MRKPSRPRPALSLPAAAAATLICLSAAAPATTRAQTPAADTAPERDYNIPAGPLSRVLTEFALQAGIQVSADAVLTEGRQSPGARGRLSVADGLNAVLNGTGLQAQRRGNAYTLRLAPEAVTLPDILVQGRPSLAQEGLASDGYRVSSVSSVGALGGMDVRSAPYSISVIPRELLENVQAQSPDDVFRINPSTLTQTPQISGWAPMVKIRGFNSYDRAEEGLRRSYGFAASIEDKERVEVLSGLSGFLFGAASPGGMVNYVYKRPTQERFNSITVGNYGGSQYYVHGDFGGPVDDNGVLGYRLNLVRQDGDTSVDDQKIDRTLATLALDLKVTDRLKFELGASYSDYKMRSPTAYWFVSDGVKRPAAMDTSKDWSQPWIRDETESRKWMARMTYEANDHLTVRVAHLREYQDRPVQYHTMNLVQAGDVYKQLRQKVGPTRTESEAWQALADVSFDTGAVGHKVTMGYYGYTDRQWQTTYFPHTGYVGPYSLSSPTHVPEPDWPSDADARQYFSSRIRNDNFMIGDMVRLNEQWSVLLGVNRSTIKYIDRNQSGEPTQPDYDRGRTSPNASLIYLPAPWLTTYATYIEGLEQGGVAPDEAMNRTQVLAPMRSKQKELGIKAELGGVLVSGALFDIEKAYEYINNADVYVQDGIQRHRGAEVSAVGKATEAWTIMGGATWLQARVQGGENDGNAPINVPKVVLKLYSEYALPFAPGLSLTGGIYHIGKQWATDTNSSRLPSYTTFDLGLRYTTKVNGHPVTLRLAVNNVADRNYWLNSYYLGNPRTIAFSAQTQF